MRLRGTNLVFASWADASDRPRPDGQEDDDGVAILEAPEENCWFEQR